MGERENKNTSVGERYGEGRTKGKKKERTKEEKMDGRYRPHHYGEDALRYAQRNTHIPYLRQPGNELGAKAFPSLSNYALTHSTPAGIGLGVLENQYYDHLSCTTIAILFVGCVLCVIVGLVIAILVVAIVG